MSTRTESVPKNKDNVDTSSKIIKNQNELEDKYLLHFPSLLSSIYYAIIIVAIGLPAWYYTCSLTRHPLPNIDSLLKLTNNSATNIELKLHVTVVTVGQQVDKNIDAIKLRESLASDAALANNRLTFLWRIRRAFDTELEIFEKNVEKDEKNTDERITVIENELAKIHSRNPVRGRIWMYVIPEEYHPMLCRRKHSFTMTFERFVIICPNFDLLETRDYDPQPLVRLAMEAIQKMYSDTIDTTRLTHLLGSELNLILSLIPEDSSSRLDDDMIDLMDSKAGLVQKVFDKNVRQMFGELLEMVNMKPVTQFVLEAYEPGQINKCFINATSQDEENVRKRFFDVKKSRDLINTIRTRISEPQDRQIYHVFLLLPSLLSGQTFDKVSPIIFYENSIPTTSQRNLLTGSDQNAILIWNSDKEFVLAFRALVRHILSFRYNFPANQEPTRSTFFTRWEMDSLLAALTVAKIERSSNSLESITRLIDEVSNIVIEKDIATKMNNAFKLSLDSAQMLADGNLLDAYRASAHAFDLSESAFFDASLLKLLYFPHEQKYAIYLPLVLPLLFPLQASFNRLRAAFFAYRRQRLTAVSTI